MVISMNHTKKVILICGIICSGKSYYAKQLAEQCGAVILSTDEVTYDLTGNEQGDSYDEFARRVNRYLRKKAAEIVRAGANVILDWGFWTRADRAEIARFFQSEGIPFAWPYIDVAEDTWHRQIAQRNRAVAAGEGGSDFYVDEGLLNKALAAFEIPERDEMDVWHRVG